MRMRGLLWIVGLLMVSTIAKEARADFLTYSVTGTFADGGVLSGTFTVYPQYPPNFNLTVNDPAAPAQANFKSFGFGGYGNPSLAGSDPYAVFFNQFPFQTSLTLIVPFPSPLVNYPGGPLCSDTSVSLDCTGPSGTKYVSSIRFPPSSIYVHDGYTVNLTSGSITLIGGSLPSTVPEPSSIVLVASSLLGLAGMGGRRMMRVVSSWAS